MKRKYLAAMIACVIANSAFAAEYQLSDLKNYYSSDNPTGSEFAWFGPKTSAADTNENNRVTINLSEGTLYNAFGGYDAGIEGTNNVSNNTLTISGKSNVTAAYGGFAVNGNADNNTVIIGKDAVVESAVGGSSYTGTANNNTVVISGKVGYLGVTGGDSVEQATGNHIVLNEGSQVLGAVSGGTTGFIPLKGNNKLTVNGPATVGALSSYSAINIDLQKANAETAALTVNGGSKEFAEDLDGASVYKNVNLSDTALNVKNYGDNKKIISISDNDYIKGIYINEGTKVTSDSIYIKDEWTAKVTSETDLGNEFTTDTLNDEKYFAKQQVETKSNTTTLTDAVLGTVALVNQVNEFVADEGIKAIQNATDSTDGFATFGSVIGGYSEYQTGSHVDLSSVHALVGIAKNSGRLTSAAFAEIGYGSSSSHVKGVSADANHDYYGLGLAGRYDFDTGLYMNAGLHLGNMTTDFDGKYADGIAAYDIDQMYIGTYLGAGYEFQLSNNMRCDFYGRYSYTYVDDENTHAAGEKFTIDSVDTHALRFGGRLNGRFNEIVSGYVGLAVERVIDGDADGNISNVALDSPSLEGTTGIGELGISLTPSENVLLNIGAKGYIGDRQGVQGSLIGIYTF